MTDQQVANRPGLSHRAVANIVVLAIALVVVLGALIWVLRPNGPHPGVGDPFTATITRVSVDQTAVCYTGSPSKDGTTCAVLYRQGPVSVGQRVWGVEVWLPGRETVVQAFAVSPHP